jgi:hypothetical protein
MTVSRRPGTTGISEVSDEDVDTYIEWDDDGDDLFFEDDDDRFYHDPYGYRAFAPEWVHPDCTDPRAALDLGTCCKYPAGTLVRRALDLAEAVDRALCVFDDGDRADRECAQTARELAGLFESVRGLVAEIRAVLPGADKTVAAQLLCPVGRLSLVSLELAGRSGCPWACDDHGAPDRRPVLAPLAAQLEDCDEALWAAIVPRPRRRR